LNNSIPNIYRDIHVWYMFNKFQKIFTGKLIMRITEKRGIFTSKWGQDIQKPVFTLDSQWFLRNNVLPRWNINQWKIVNSRWRNIHIQQMPVHSRVARGQWSPRTTKFLTTGREWTDTACGWKGDEIFLPKRAPCEIISVLIKVRFLFISLFLIWARIDTTFWCYCFNGFALSSDVWPTPSEVSKRLKFTGMI
jgi:hypothetical protein